MTATPSTPSLNEGNSAMIEIQRILCPIDFSDFSRRAFDHAVAIARWYDLPRELRETVFAGPRSLPEYIALAEQDRRKRLRDAIPDSVRAYCIVDTVLATGTPYQEILRVAEEQKADLLVTGVQGQGAVDRILFGSTAQHLVRKASCPVLTLRRR